MEKRRRRRSSSRKKRQQQNAESLLKSILVGLLIIAVVAAAFTYATRSPASGSGAPLTDVDKYGRRTAPATGQQQGQGDGIMRSSQN